MKLDEQNMNHIIAGEGKVFRRISDGVILGKEIYLGYAYYINGRTLSEPLLELPAHYEEINDPADEETVILDVNTALINDADEHSIDGMSVLSGEKESEGICEKRVVTLADYKSLERKVEQLIQMLGGVE